MAVLLLCEATNLLTTPYILWHFKATKIYINSTTVNVHMYPTTKQTASSTYRAVRACNSFQGSNQDSLQVIINIVNLNSSLSLRQLGVVDPAVVTTRPVRAHAVALHDSYRLDWGIQWRQSQH